MAEEQRESEDLADGDAASRGDAESAAESDEAVAEEAEADAEDEADAEEAEAASGGDGEKGRFGSIFGILSFLAALAGGFYIGQVMQQPDPGQWPGYDDRARYKVDLRGHEPQEGPDDALVTIIEFSDYECPFCKRAHEPLMEALEDHDDVRLIFKHMPLPMHAKAIPAARAAWAAQQQGKFWELHEYLFEVGGDLTHIEQAVEDEGLDLARFKADMVSEAAKQALESDRYAAGVLGIGSTPHFVVNGRHIRGALARDHWEKVIEVERAEAQALIDSGTPRSEVYATMMKDAATKRAAPSRGPDPLVRHPVVAGEGRPSLGPADALVTVVEFSDFQCPYCAKLAPTIHALPDRHADVRIVFRQLPLGNHALARPAAKAALAAHRQGQFWAMHDALFERGGKITVDDIDDIAEQIGLDMARFAVDREDPTIEQMIAEDEALARQVGVRGTPASFVNGRFVGGAQEADVFDATIERERQAARALVDAGTPPERVLEQLIARDAEPPSAGAQK